MDATRTTHLGESLDRLLDPLGVAAPEAMTRLYLVAFGRDRRGRERVLVRRQRRRLLSPALHDALLLGCEKAAARFRHAVEFARHLRHGLLSRGLKVVTLRVQPIYIRSADSTARIDGIPELSIESAESRPPARPAAFACLTREAIRPDRLDLPSLPRIQAAGGCSARFAPTLFG